MADGQERDHELLAVGFADELGKERSGLARRAKGGPLR
jgi:hypothetical protein